MGKVRLPTRPHVTNICVSQAIGFTVCTWQASVSYQILTGNLDYRKLSGATSQKFPHCQSFDQNLCTIANVRPMLHLLLGKLTALLIPNQLLKRYSIYTGSNSGYTYVLCTALKHMQCLHIQLATVKFAEGLHGSLLRLEYNQHLSSTWLEVEPWLTRFMLLHTTCCKGIL